MVFARISFKNNILYITFTGKYDSYKESLEYIEQIKDLYLNSKSFFCIFDITQMSNLTYSELLNISSVFKKHLYIFKTMEHLSKTFMKCLVIKLEGYWCQFFVNMLLKIKRPVINNWKVCATTEEYKKFITKNMHNNNLS